jgi:DNA-binding NarL/FixJ family response regulator
MLKMMESVAGPPVERIATAAARNRWRVLVIDDELLLGRSIRRMLKAHDVVLTTSAEEATQLLEADVDFDAILCDLLMPAMTGIQFYTRLSERRPELCRRVVFMSGGGYPARVRHFVDQVPNTTLQKPFAVDELEAAIHTLIGASYEAER